MRLLLAQSKMTAFKNILLALTLVVLSSGCAKYRAIQIQGLDEQDKMSQDEPIEEPETPEEPHVEEPAFIPEPLAWESASKPFRADWSEYTLQIVNEEYEKFDQVQDATLFCSSFNSLSKQQKINFWGQLIAAMSYYESGWSPVSRMHETTMGTDPVTGLPVYSEGLLQLSYQDTQWAKYCEFNWSQDKYLSPTDPKKTILDPYKNLRCGIKILAAQVARKKEIALQTGVYWAVIREGGKYTKIPQITTMVKKLTFCQ